MKTTLLLFAAFLSQEAFAQQTIHSIASGAFGDPANWDCLCIPDPEDKVFIHHNMTTDSDRTIAGGGVLWIFGEASLTQTQDRQLVVTGAGSQLNIYGMAGFANVTFTDNGEGFNHGQFSVDRKMHFGYNSNFTNYDLMDGMDSLLLESAFINNGTIYTGNFLNSGIIINNGRIVADSLGNDGTFNVYGGSVTAAVFGNSENFSMFDNGYLDIFGNWYNFGDFSIYTNPVVYVGANAYNGDTTDGHLFIKGGMIINGDFINLQDVSGMGGRICMGGYSANAGAWAGTFDFCDATGGNIDLNIGTIGAGITFCTNGCNLGTEENGAEAITLYPNPASGKLFIESSAAFETAEFYSLAGEQVLSVAVNGKTIALAGLQAGIYFVQLIGETAVQPVRVVIE